MLSFKLFIIQISALVCKPGASPLEYSSAQLLPSDKLASEYTKSPLSKETVDPMLRTEIVASLLQDVPGLLPIVFPDECLPLSPSETLAALSAGPSPLYRGYTWVGCPDLNRQSFQGDVEAELVAFFDTFGERVTALCTASGKPLPRKKRTWTAQFTNNGGKPELVLGDDPEYCWTNIQIHCDLKPNDSSELREKALNQLLNGAHLIFSHQDNRHFVVSIAFMAEIIMLFVFDRAGLVTTAPFHLHENPMAFVRVLTAIMFANDPAMLGYDTSIVQTDNDRRSIEVAGMQYDVVGKALFISDVMRGRGTVCWRVHHSGQDFVIKDTWDDDSRPYAEAQILHMAASVYGVPKLVADIIVKVNNVEGRTDRLRSHLPPPTESSARELHEIYSQIEKRVHRRVVLTPFGHALSTFASRKELISVFIDAVKAHRDLYEKAKVLHRDISVNNILLVPSDDLLPTSSTAATLAGPATENSVAGDAVATSPGLRRGLLIDLDCALVLDDDSGRGSTATGHRIGTLPFMAIDILVEGDELHQHEPHHDLESFLYVLIWVCVHYAGPSNAERQNFDINHSKLKPWVHGESYVTIGKAKAASMMVDKYWKTDVLDNFAPYFEPLKPCVTAWRKSYRDGELTYDAALEVLQAALSSLSDQENWSAADDPEGYGVGTTKGLFGRDEDPDMNEARPPKVSRNAMGHRDIHSAPAPDPSGSGNTRKSVKNSMRGKQRARRAGSRLPHPI
ncbi:hypothetical protein B0H12DRAFT_716381 [Mycena haematopus]|nr:hypothetical protein B0H12DRAFT_716381 [Mycena haematopus]